MVVAETTTGLNLLDEFYLHLDREDEPWSVHLEVGVEGRLDPERMSEAIRAGVRAHPLARARLLPARATDLRYRWEIADELDQVPLIVAFCADDQELEAARERLMGTSPSLEDPPPFGVTLAHHPAGDSLMLNLSHAAGDGMSAVRLMASFLRAYADLDDPVPPVDPLEVRDIGRLVNSSSPRARLARSRTLIEQAGRITSAPARIAPQGGGERPGYGFSLLDLGAIGLEAVRRHRRGGATVNDVLLGALGVTVARWNEQHGAEPAAASVMMPVNLRPPEWRTEVVGNFASIVSVPLGTEDCAELPTAIEAAAESTRRIKSRGAGALVVDLLELPTATLPTAVKQRLQDLIVLTGSRLVDTTVLSNLGRLDALPPLDQDAGEVRRVWFSPPGRMPLGLSLGAATYNGELFLCLRHRRSLFDAQAAEAFAAMLRKVLTSPSQEA